MSRTTRGASRDTELWRTWTNTWGAILISHQCCFSASKDGGCYLVTSGDVFSLPNDSFVALNAAAAATIPLSPSYFSHRVRLRDMVRPSNGLEFTLWGKKSLVPPLRPPQSENQNKRWRRHTAPLMATLGSATTVSLNRLMHHFAFVPHNRDLCVCVCVCRALILFHPVLLSLNGCSSGWALPSRVHFPPDPEIFFKTVFFFIVL